MSNEKLRAQLVNRCAAGKLTRCVSKPLKLFNFNDLFHTVCRWWDEEIKTKAIAQSTARARREGINKRMRFCANDVLKEKESRCEKNCHFSVCTSLASLATFKMPKRSTSMVLLPEFVILPTKMVERTNKSVNK